MESEMESRIALGISALILVTTIAATPALVSTKMAAAFSCRDLVDAPVAAVGEKVYVTWATNKSGNWEVIFRASNDSGRTFGDKINLSNSLNADSIDPSVSANGENMVSVSFHDSRNGSVDTYVTTSTDGGKTFGPLVKINGTGTIPQESLIIPPENESPLTAGEAQENTQIASSGDNNIYVVSWDKKSGNWEVLFAASNDSGATFGDTINLSNTPDAKSDRAWLTVEGNNVYVSWWEMTGGNSTSTGGVQEPVMRVSHDNGATFGPTFRVAADGPIGGV
ncbi:MAG: glycoside hydrolase [Thermoproteota archaeon]|nr:glycoside hydrolase [Thermoproteota archaeon]